LKLKKLKTYIQDLPRGRILTQKGIVYKGYIEQFQNSNRLDVYEDDGQVYRVPLGNIDNIKWEEKWKEEEGKTLTEEQR